MRIYARQISGANQQNGASLKTVGNILNSKTGGTMIRGTSRNRSSRL